ncbi:alpha/beta fold hydrolase, partial [Patulibacter sp. S7RM1-6]
MSRLARRALPLPLLAAALLLAGGPASAGAARTYPCGDASVGRTRCSRVTVPLDRTGAIPGRVSLSVRRVQAGQKRARVRREAVLFLSGGPGQATTPDAAALTGVLAPLLERRDLLTVDTRGTGRSSDLIVCPELETTAVTALSQSDLVGSCARRLGGATDRYGTTDVVADLEAVRQASGYARLVVVGVSYGTYTAQRYAAAHPDRVSGLVLDSTVDGTGDDPYTLATVRAAPTALARTCRAGACRG